MQEQLYQWAAEAERLIGEMLEWGQLANTDYEDEFRNGQEPPFEIAVPQETGRKDGIANYQLQHIAESEPRQWPFHIWMSNGGSSTTDPNFATRLERSAHRLCADAAERIDKDLRKALITSYAGLPTEQTSAADADDAPRAIEELCWDMDAALGPRLPGHERQINVVCSAGTWKKIVRSGAHWLHCSTPLLCPTARVIAPQVIGNAPDDRIFLMAGERAFTRALHVVALAPETNNPHYPLGVLLGGWVKWRWGILDTGSMHRIDLE